MTEQITREQLSNMTPAEINAARLAGKLNTLMTTPNGDKTVTPISKPVDPHRWKQGQ